MCRCFQKSCTFRSKLRFLKNWLYEAQQAKGQHTKKKKLSEMYHCLFAIPAHNTNWKRVFSLMCSQCRAKKNNNKNYVIWKMRLYYVILILNKHYLLNFVWAMNCNLLLFCAGGIKAMFLRHKNAGFYNIVKANSKMLVYDEIW